MSIAKLTLIGLFQSTLLQEERLLFDLNSHHFYLFQSTLLQEERPKLLTIVCISVNFNPRSYKRSDPDFVFPLILIMISIHAPTRGATITLVYTDSLHLNFNPRSYKRSDHDTDALAPLHLQFQSTLLQEERQQKGYELAKS